MPRKKTTETKTTTKQHKIGFAAVAGIVSGAVRAVVAWIAEHLVQ